MLKSSSSSEESNLESDLISLHFIKYFEKFVEKVIKKNKKLYNRIKLMYKKYSIEYDEFNDFSVLYKVLPVCFIIVALYLYILCINK